MKKQRGQVIIEFALILPLFLLMIFGLFYSGMLFYDYSTLSNVARSAARETAISSDVITISENNNTGQTVKTVSTTALDTIISHYYVSGSSGSSPKFEGGGLITSLYTPKVGEIDTDESSSGDGAFVIKVDTTKDPADIIVSIVMELNTSLPWIDIVLPEKFTIRYHMSRDTKS